MSALSFDEIPVVDFELSLSNRQAFLRDLHHALCHVGFMVLVNAPGLGTSIQDKAFEMAHSFFDAPQHVKGKCLQVNSPQFRGYGNFRTGKIGIATEAYQFGPEEKADDSPSAPLLERIMHGPNIWPDHPVAKDFKDTLLDLHQKLGELEKQLGHLICELLEVDHHEYERYFEGGYYIASMNHMHAACEFSEKERLAIIADQQQNGKKSAGSHVDGAPFVTLLVADQPGLEVFSHGSNKWVEVPVIPGSVVVNIGGTLQKLSSGRMVATLHRVNPLSATKRRISLPFFRMPRFDSPLEAFDGSPIVQRDRGLNYCYDRMKLFPEVTARWYKDDFPEVEAMMEKEAIARKAARSRL